ncbi:hypothetical protein [Janibacter terrae]|uniref:hypothetical protein n=1 Tax=Janibacter terrae TaxID=103817 RepID=UPI0038298CAD
MKVTAEVVRSGHWWAIEVPQVPGVFTQAKRLDQVAGVVADAVATMTGVDADEVEVSLSAALRPEIQRDIDEAIRCAMRRKLREHRPLSSSPAQSAMSWGKG